MPESRTQVLVQENERGPCWGTGGERWHRAEYLRARSGYLPVPL